jgi:DNA-(apurinic or apyrimidinic site) lyase
MDIPLDVRLKKISPSREFWKRLAKEVGIPPLHLDAIVWTTLGGNEKFFNSFEDKDLKEKLKRLKEVLEKLTG